jgi:hypothetical protein
MASWMLAFVYMHNDQFCELFVGSTGPGGTVNTYGGLINLDFGNFFIAGSWCLASHTTAVTTLTGLLVLASMTSLLEGCSS